MGLLDKVKEKLGEGQAHSTPADDESQERGRFMASTGRGGAGNMSRSRARQVDESPEVIAAARSRSQSRSRAAHHGHEPHVTAGRGGTGNVRSTSTDAKSRERQAALDAEERIVEDKYAAKHAREESVQGRGGLGNIPHHAHHNEPA
ncbi:BQ2448_8095 [Microbotryum intermedium]|uniref:BQ2448_8095 protein n=1 Tax=Microbotryum intermedium TaxID=269621 RepID=A0A238FTP3_9BASI|nr:BQ2448_8095 [Microbotryum intermedium]